jgi:hypothetical protein
MTKTLFASVATAVFLSAVMLSNAMWLYTGRAAAPVDERMDQGSPTD